MDLQRLKRSAGIEGDEADAHIEGAEHLVLLDIAELLQVLEDGQNRPAAELDVGGGVFGQDARQVLGDSATGDVGHAAGVIAGGQLFDEAQVAAVSLHERGPGFLL